ncbi:MAG: hypothetical protein JHD06_08160 [Rhodoferax sp.]|jgi:hypothetical protein|nr:hypothetical protein [Rhodoferax sp.]
MPSLAYTDGILALICLWLLTRASLPIGVRIAAGTLGLAAVLGVLRFSGLYPIPQWHQFVSMLGACAAFPLLAVAVLWPDAAATRQLKFASIFFIGMAVLGVLAVGVAQKRVLVDALTVISVVAMLISLARGGRWPTALTTALMLAGLLLFASKATVVPGLVPGDLLHIGMAIGLFGLGASSLWQDAANLDTLESQPQSA